MSLPLLIHHSLSLLSKGVMALLLTLPVAVAGEPVASDTWKRVLADGQTAVPENTERWEVQSGSFVIASDMPSEPSLTCYYAVPAAKNGRIPPRRNRAVYFFHTPDPKSNVLDNGLCNRLVSDLGVSVFGIAFKESSQAGLFYGNRESQQRFYAFAKSGSFNAMLTAWSVMRRQFGITGKRFYLYGYSAGGIGVQRFAEEYPEFCAGIISVNGHSFTQKNQSACPALVIHSMGDGGSSSGLGLLRFYSAIGTPCQRLLVSPSWERMKEGNDFAFHALHGSVTDLTITWLDALIAMSDERNPDVLVPATAWPYVASVEDPLVIAPLRGKSIHNVLPPGATPMLIPSARFYARMLTNPLPPLHLTADNDQAVVIRPRPDQPAHGLVLMQEPRTGSTVDEPGELSDELVLDGQFLADHGYLALATHQDPPPTLASRIDRLIPAKSTLRSGHLVIDPAPGQVTASNTSHLVILFSKPVALESYLTEFQALLNRGTRLLVLLPYRTRAEYDAALAAVNPAIRTQLFPPFDVLGKNAELSLRQQQREAALAFFDRWLRGGR